MKTFQRSSLFQRSSRKFILSVGQLHFFRNTRIIESRCLEQFLFLVCFTTPSNLGARSLHGLGGTYDNKRRRIPRFSHGLSDTRENFPTILTFSTILAQIYIICRTVTRFQKYKNHRVSLSGTVPFFGLFQNTIQLGGAIVTWARGYL